MGAPLRLLAAALVLALATAASGQGTKPRVPAGRDPGGVAVAVIGNGVNYTLPQIAQRLARDGEGELVGWDFADEDRRPFERPNAGTPGAGGTAAAGIVLREAPAARLAIVRTRPGDKLAHAKGLAVAGSSQVRIALVGIAGERREEWELFGQAASHFAQVLLIVPAGDEGRNLDEAPLFPAALGTGHMIVVVGADAEGAPLPGSNRGPRTIDVAVPAAGVEAPDSDGARIRVSGSSAAAARLAALAARIAAAEPALAGAALKQRILSLAKPLPAAAAAQTRAGWIADPQQLPGRQ